nr:hypothetical protein [uncultured Holophaga sp.]
MQTDAEAQQRGWVLGDLSGFLGLMIDNLAVLAFLAGVLVAGFQFPADVVYRRMFPGTALGVLLGDLAYAWMAKRLARRTGNPGVTAMPLGLDTPSTIGLALVVLGPAFLELKGHGLLPEAAALGAWRIGMAVMVLMGLIKLALSFCGDWVRRQVPRAGLLGSLAGLSLALMGFLPLLDIFSLPLIGLLALALVLATLAGRLQLPFRIPGILAAVILGTALYHLLGPLGLAGGAYRAPVLTLHPGLPLPTLGFLQGLPAALHYLPLALPFAILTVVGGINVTESARAAGDDFPTRDILLVEALATLVAGVCGGVAQSTPYIGQPAYKAMGARSGYVVLTGLFIGLGGMLGLVSFFVELIPRAVLAPILVFVALEIMVQATLACPRRHAPAVALAYLPSLAQLLSIKLSTLLPAALFASLLVGTGPGTPELLLITALGSGFIITGMLWGSVLADTVDRRFLRAALSLAVLALLSFFGVIHSASPHGAIGLPWRLPEAVQRAIPYRLSLAYLVLAGLALLAPWLTRSTPPPPEASASPGGSH